MRLSQAFSIKVFLPLMVVVAWLAACLDQSSTQLPLNPALKSGDQIDGMILTNGAADAPPLWVFCSPTPENQHVTKTECRIPPTLTRVAIGHVLNIVSEVPDDAHTVYSLAQSETVTNTCFIIGSDERST